MKLAVVAVVVLAIGCEKQSLKGSVTLADLEARVRQLEEASAKREEALRFLDLAYEQTMEQQTKPTPDGIYAVDIAPNLALGAVEGPANAPVTIVDVWDFACPHCYNASKALKSILEKNPGKVRLVFKNMVVHPQQVAQAHLMGCAAAKQGKFTAFYHAWWEHGYGPYFNSQGKDSTSMDPKNLPAIAARAGIDVRRAAGDEVECQKIIAQDEAELRKFKVGGTPAFFINGQFIGGGIPEEAFQKIIDEKLKVVQDSGVPAADYYAKEILAKGEREVVRKRPGATPH
jgi:protein-disulfide isomerase